MSFLTLQCKSAQGKQSKDKPNTNIRTADTTDSQDQSTTVRESKASEKENSEAVSQLLQSALPDQNEDWEEVIISDAHFKHGKPQANESALTEKRQRSIKPAENNDTKTDKPPTTGSTKDVPQASVSK